MRWVHKSGNDGEPEFVWLDMTTGDYENPTSLPCPLALSLTSLYAVILKYNKRFIVVFLVIWFAYLVSGSSTIHTYNTTFLMFTCFAKLANLLLSRLNFNIVTFYFSFVRFFNFYILFNKAEHFFIGMYNLVTLVSNTSLLSVLSAIL